MRQYQTFLAMTAVVAVTALSGCASKQPAPTAVVVVPQTQASAAQQTTTAAVRSGTVVDIRSSMASANSQGSTSSGGSASSGASSSGQLLTVQFDDGTRQFFDVAPGGLQFQVGERVTVNTTQGTALITR